MGIGASVLLLAIGAMFAYAFDIDPNQIGGMTVDWNVVGVILMLAGAFGLVWSLIVLGMARREDERHDIIREERDRIIER
jgi:hypothetical protein